jgi:hypothetical protein
LETIRLVKEQLSHVDGVSFDQNALEGLVIGICSLACHEVEPTLTRVIQAKHRKAPFNSPLVDAGWLSYYGAILHNPLHLSALINLVLRRGGLEAFTTPNYAEILS